MNRIFTELKCKRMLCYRITLKLSCATRSQLNIVGWSVNSRASISKGGITLDPKEALVLTSTSEI
jgi:hypothetical protein